MIKWKNLKKGNPQIDILVRHLEMLDKSSSGVPQLFLGREYVALTALLEWDSVLAEHDRADIVWDVLTRVAKRSKITASDIIRELNLAEQAILKGGTQEYVLFTFVSINPTLQISRRKVGDATITISPNPPRSLVRELATYHFGSKIG